MAEHCENCGAELFPGQRFCRSCGRPTGSEENIPTQQMPTQPRGPANTSPTAGSETSPVYNPQASYYQPPPYQPAYSQYSAPHYQPPTRSRSPWGWIIALLGIGLFAFVVLGIFVGVRATRETRRRITPPPPPAAEQQGGTVIDERGAVVTGNETTITNTYALQNTATVTLRNVSGSISVEGWDQPNAEVKIIKRGGSAQDRRNARVIVESDPSKLSLNVVAVGGRSNVTVEYEVKLPRQVGKLELSGASSDVELRDITAAISVNTASGSVEIRDAVGNISVNAASGDINIQQVQGKVVASSHSGSIKVTDVTGTVSTRTMSGETEVVFASVARGEPLEFSSVSGSIEIVFQDEPNIDLTAETVSGNIDIDGDFGLEVEKKIVGERVSGRVGEGGQALKINTVSGEITLSK